MFTNKIYAYRYSNFCRRTKNTEDKTETKTEKTAETCVTPRLITKESNRRANERMKEAWQANGNVRLTDENRIQNGLFTAKEDDRDRTEWR